MKNTKSPVTTSCFDKIAIVTGFTAAIATLRYLFLGTADGIRCVNTLYSAWYTLFNSPQLERMPPDYSWMQTGKEWPYSRKLFNAMVELSGTLQVHAFSSAVIIVCCTLNTWEWFRKADYERHKKIGNLAMLLVACAELTSVPLSLKLCRQFGTSGVLGGLGFIVLAAITLCSALMGWYHIRKDNKDIVQHKLWMRRFNATLWSGFWGTRICLFLGPLFPWVAVLPIGGWVAALGGVVYIELHGWCNVIDETKKSEANVAGVQMFDAITRDE